LELEFADEFSVGYNGVGLTPESAEQIAAAGPSFYISLMRTVR
jgi:hypothetical protein